jgi:uncharacterized membrane protein HdeD (DUF308 family)
MVSKETIVDERLKKRMFWFYFAGVVNLVLGLYVLIEGPALMGSGTATIVALFFFAFAAVDFYFPRAMKRKWEEQMRMLGQQNNPSGRP